MHTGFVALNIMDQMNDWKSFSVLGDSFLFGAALDPRRARLLIVLVREHPPPPRARAWTSVGDSKCSTPWYSPEARNECDGHRHQAVYAVGPTDK